MPAGEHARARARARAGRSAHAAPVVPRGPARRRRRGARELRGRAARAGQCHLRAPGRALRGCGPLAPRRQARAPRHARRSRRARLPARARVRELLRHGHLDGRGRGRPRAARRALAWARRHALRDRERHLRALRAGARARALPGQPAAQRHAGQPDELHAHRGRALPGRAADRPRAAHRPAHAQARGALDASPRPPSPTPPSPTPPSPAGGATGPAS